MISNSQQLHPNKSTKTQPRVDGFNFSKISKNSLHMRDYLSAESGGRMGGVWWLLWTVVFIVLFAIINMIFLPDFRKEVLGEDWFIGAYAMLAIMIAYSPFFIIWRLELPICFNRQTRKVSFMVKGRLAQVNWDDIETRAKIARTIVAGSGALNKEQIVTFNVYYNMPYAKDTVKHNITIMGTDYWEGDDPIAGAKALWEYIYIFMEKGEDALPKDKISGGGCSLIRSMKEHNPFPQKGFPLSDNIFNFVALPLGLPMSIISIITDMIYCVLDFILPKRGLPSLLREACEAEKLKY